MSSTLGVWHRHGMEKAIRASNMQWRVCVLQAAACMGSSQGGQTSAGAAGNGECALQTRATQPYLGQLTNIVCSGISKDVTLIVRHFCCCSSCAPSQAAVYCSSR